MLGDNASGRMVKLVRMNKLFPWKSQFLPYWVIGLLASTSVALFANSWSNPFILDDIVKIVNNGDLRNIERLGDTLVYPYGPVPTRNRNDPSRPLVYLVYTVIYHFWADQSVPYHIVNTVIHFGNGVLVYLLMGVFFKNIYVSVFMALLFLLLPIQAGVAIYAYGLSDVLSSFFVLLAFFTFVRGSMSHSREASQGSGGLEVSLRPMPSGQNSCLVVVYYILALASKQIGIVLPLILVLYESCFFPFRKGHANIERFRAYLKRLVLMMMPVGFVTLLYLGLRYFYLGGIGDLEGFQEIQSSANYLSVQGMVILKYLQLTLVPLGLTIDHGVMPGDYSGPFLFFCWTIVVGLGIYGYQMTQSLSLKKKEIGFGILFYLAALLPTSALPTVDCLVERRVYLANFGLLLVMARLGMTINLGSMIRKLGLRGSPWKLIAGVVLLFSYFIVSYERNSVFASERLIWEESLSSYPGYSRAIINSAWNFILDKQYERGEKMLNLVLKYMPRSTEVLAKLGTLYDMSDYVKNDSATALFYFQRSIEVDPEYFVGRYLAAGILIKLKRLTEAKQMLQKVVEIHSNFSPAYLLLGKIAEAENEFKLAESYFRTAREIDPAGKPF